MRLVLFWLISITFLRNILKEERRFRVLANHAETLLRISPRIRFSQALRESGKDDYSSSQLSFKTKGVINVVILYGKSTATLITP